MNRNRAFAGLVLALLLVSLVPVAAAAQPPRAPVDPNIELFLEGNGRATILVVLAEQANLEGARLLRTKEEKGRYVYEQLTAIAARTQPAVRSYLDQLGVPYKSFWIRNMFQVEVTSMAQVNALAGRSDVGAIEYLYPTYLDVDFTASRPAAQPNVIEWNIDRVDADLVWGMGITGQGAVVADLDTGVQYNHPALVQQYRGCVDPPACTTFDHNYNWWEGPSGAPEPYDTGSHGTHTMGTAIGSDLPSDPLNAPNAIGMAPGAKWIACPGIGSPLVGPFECFEWFLAPTDLQGQNPRFDLAPHVINNSWSSTGTNYRDIIHTLYMAGIFYSKSAGNTGPNCGTITNPGQWPEVLANAAYGNGDYIASFSSRGPVIVDRETVVKPDIANPGSGVRSSIPGSGYGTMSGTSMACPHGTGGVALLISAVPELAGQIDTLQYILKYTAEPKIDAQCAPYVDRPNDVWGWGIMNIKAAVDYALAQTGYGWLNGRVTAAAGGEPLPDAKLDLTQDSTGWRFMTHEVDAAGYYSYTLLPVGSYHITGTAYGYLPGVYAVTIQDQATTTQNIALQTAPQWTISGYVREEGTGEPLAATLTFEGTPVVATTNPATGYYSTTIYQGEFWTIVQSPGHSAAVAKILIEGDVTQDFTLTAVYNYHLRENGDPCGPAFNWIDARDGTRLCLDDDAAVTIALDHDITFYGNTYNNMYVGSNGLATFQPPATSAPARIPDPAAPNNGLYAFAVDLDPNFCHRGEIFYKWVDGNIFVLEYYQIEHYPSGDPETFEIVIDADTGLVIMQYLTVSNPAGIIVGVENSAGTEATQYMGTVTNGTALAYYPAFDTPPWQGTGTMAGAVTDAATSGPIAGALVEVYNPFAVLFTATTDLSGTYSMDLCSDFYVATASAEGYLPGAPQDVTVLDGETAVADFALCPPLTFTGFVWTPTAPMAGEVVTFTATATSTAPLLYEWSFGDGMTGTGAIVQHAYAADGDYNVAVMVTNGCLSDGDADVITVATPQIVPPYPVPPVGLYPGGQAYNSFTIANTGTADLEWSLAEAPDAPWLEESTVSGVIAPGASFDIQITYTAPLTPGLYTTVLRIASNDPISPAVDVLVEMQVATPCVRVEIEAVTPTIAGCAVTFTAALQGEPPFAYLWGFGDGITSTEAMPTHLYAASGVYSATLFVENCGGDGYDEAYFTVAVDCTVPPTFEIYLPLVVK